MTWFHRAFPTSFLLCCGISVWPVAAQQVRYSTAHRNGERALPQTVSATNQTLQTKLSVSRVPVSLAAADFNSDGTQDLLSGYAAGSSGVLLLQAGNAEAKAPTQEEEAQIATGVPVVPFAARAEATEVPVRPDLLATGDLAGHGHVDVVVAAKGDSKAYLLLGDGAGNFAAPQVLPLEGAASAVAVWKGPGGMSLVAASVCGGSGCGVQMISADGTMKAFVPTSGPAGSLQVAALNGGRYSDLLAVTSGGVLVLDGGSLLSDAPQRATLPLVGATAVAPGLFAYDRRAFAQVAVLDAQAVLHVFARAGVDETMPTRAQVAAARRLTRAAKTTDPTGASAGSLAWSEVETVANVGSGGPAVMLRGRFTGGGYDDLAVMSRSDYVTVSHPIKAEGSLRRTTPTVTVDSMASPVTAAVTTRLSASSLLGVVTAGGSEASPKYTVPSSNRVMTVTTTADAVVTSAARSACINVESGCTLRAAIAVANADAGTTTDTRVDTIQLPAGTFVISANNGSTVDAYGSYNYHFDVDSSVNFVGAGSGSTIINANGIDKAFTVNSGVVNGFAPYDVYFSGLTIENGDDKNNPDSSQCEANCDFYGGNMDSDSGGPGTLGFSSVILSGGKLTYDEDGGGGLFVSNAMTGATGPSGLTEFDNCTISNNTALLQGGGAVVAEYVPLTLNTDVFTGNSATPASGDTAAEGGALWLAGNINNTGTVTPMTISNSTFTSNTAALGGAIFDQSSNPAISGSTFSDNSATQYGGAIYLFTGYQSGPTITTSNFTGNSVPAASQESGYYSTNGGAICVEGGYAGNPNDLSVQYSRFHGNTGGHATGIGVGCANSTSGSDTSANVTATNNWWGCNGAATGTGCDTADDLYSNSALTLTPYTTLTLAVSPSSVTEGASVTATGSLGQNSAGTKYSQANDAAYLGVAAKLTLMDGGYTSTASPGLSATANTAVSYAAATLSAIARATGNGTATVTVDGYSVSSGYLVTAPDLTVTSAHSGSFKAGDTADTYTLSVANVGTGSTSGTVTVVDTLPSGFTATALSGSGWTCTLSSLSCTSNAEVAASVTFPPITLTVSVSSSDVGNYTNAVRVSGGDESNTANDTGTDSTLVIGAPMIAEAFSPLTVAQNASSTVTFTLANPNSSTTLAGVGFTDTLPSGLVVFLPSGASTTCSGGKVTATAGGGSIALSGASLASSTSCTVSVNVTSGTAGSYVNVTGAVTSTTSNAGKTASATLNVASQATMAPFVSQLTVAEGQMLPIDIIFSYPGSVPAPAPTGAISITVDGSTASLSGMSCKFKNSDPQDGAHTNCSVNYQAPASAGTHTLNYSQAADASYTSVSGSATITVTQ